MIQSFPRRAMLPLDLPVMALAGTQEGCPSMYLTACVDMLSLSNQLRMLAIFG